MAEGEVAHDLQEDAERHGRNTESVISDSSHRDKPRDDHRDEGGVGQVGVDALHRAEPEEADKEERDATDNPEE